MSVLVMAKAWALRGLNAGERVVLLALSDHADDNGYCWPSVALLAFKCEMTERGVQKIVRRLEERGVVLVEVSAGRTSNRYRVVPDPDQPSFFDDATGPTRTPPQARNPERRSPNNVRGSGGSTPNTETVNPEQECTQPRTAVHPNRKEPSKEPSAPRARGSKKREALEFDADLGVSPDVLAAYLEHRNVKKAKPTAHAMRLLSIELRKLRDRNGIQPDDVVNHAILKGWTGFKASWNFADLTNSIPQQPAYGAKRPQRVDRFQADPELREIRDRLRVQGAQ